MPKKRKTLKNNIKTSKSKFLSANPSRKGSRNTKTLKNSTKPFKSKFLSANPSLYASFAEAFGSISCCVKVGGLGPCLSLCNDRCPWSLVLPFMPCSSSTMVVWLVLLVPTHLAQCWLFPLCSLHCRQAQAFRLPCGVDQEDR